MKEISTRWSVNESLLQSYRSIFISSQSFTIAIGVLLFEKSYFVFIPIMVISLIMICIIWLPVVISRHKIVDYYKHSIELDEAELKTLCSEAEYVNDKVKRDAANQILKLSKGNWTKTRVKLDSIIPILFSLFWIFLLVFKIWKI